MSFFSAAHGRRLLRASCVHLIELVAISLAGVASASAESAGMPSDTARLNISWSLDLVSRYSFQGVDYSGGQPVLQPTLSLGYGAVSGSLWFNHDLDLRRSDEFDWSLEVEHAAGPVTVTGGYAYMRYPHREGWAPSQEVHADLATALPLAPSLSIHDDFESGKGLYLTAGLSRAVIEAPLAVTLDTRLFYQRHYYECTGIPAVEFRLGAGFGLGDTSVAPAVSRFETWENGDFRGDSAVKPAWVFGLSLGEEY